MNAHPKKLDTSKLDDFAKDNVVYVVDDDEAVRQSLSWLLESNGFKTSCHESAERFLQALNSGDDQSICCALLDINLGGMSGLELHQELLSLGQKMPVAFITGYGEISTAVNALKNGAIDFIQKPIKEEALNKLIRSMLNKAYTDQETQIELADLKEKFQLLTSREKDVLARIIAGRTNKEVGKDLGITVKTVEAHRANLMDKLKVSRPTKLLQVAFKHQEAKARGLI